MTTSGTSTFNLDIMDIMEEAYEMVGVEMRNGYDARTAKRSIDLLLHEWANRGVNLWTLEEIALPVTANTPTITLPADTVDVLDASWRTGTGIGQTDRQMTRISVMEWSSMANKNMVSPPTEYFINRLAAAPVMHIWPIPVVDGTLVYWKMRLVQDTGNYENTIDIPSRFLPALTSGLAFYLAIKTPAASERLPILQQEYERQFQYAYETDRERASLWLTPGIC
jgi:hypothetical protein